MYIAGRMRTASSPSRTWIESAAYDALAARFDLLTGLLLSAARAGTLGLITRV